MRSTKARQIAGFYDGRLMANLFHQIERVASARRDAIAFDCMDAGSFTFADLLDRAARFAAALTSLGVRPGDRVTVQLEKSIDGVWLYLAVLRVGAIYLPLNSGYTDAEIEYFVNDAEPSLIVVEPTRLDAVGAIASRARLSARTTTLADLQHRAASALPDEGIVARADGDVAAILYTSGTTGRSKGAMISHRNLASNATTLIDIWGFTSGDVLVHALPIYHVHGLFVALHCALLSGATTRFLPRFEIGAVLKALAGASVFMGVPTYYTRLLGAADFPQPDISLRLWISGSAPLLPETFAAFEQRTGVAILERYGMTEAGMITSNPLRGPRLAGTVGKPLPGVAARVRREDGSLAPTGEPGILEISGPNVFGGYWRNEEKTKAAFTHDGYFVTGDVVTMDSAGVVSIVGRQNDLIISGGLNVYPKEIEEQIDALHGVTESAVIGVPHPDFGEGVVAVVDRASDVLEEADIIGPLRERLAGFKVPKRVVFVETLPRNAMGKVQKKLLRETYRSLFEAPR
jgi:malonyl-CoA/methylmalonyl-CoA synthetase